MKHRRKAIKEYHCTQWENACVFSFVVLFVLLMFSPLIQFTVLVSGMLDLKGFWRLQLQIPLVETNVSSLPHCV